MPVLKVRCPDCDAPVRETIDAVEEPTEFTLTCPKCDTEFCATVEPDAPAKPKKKQPTKAGKGEDNEDDAPKKKKKKKKPQARSNTPLIAGVAIGAVLLIGGAVAAFVAFGGSGNKGKPVAQAADSSPATPTAPSTTPSTTDAGTTSAATPGKPQPVKPGRPNGAGGPPALNLTPNVPGPAATPGSGPTSPAAGPNTVPAPGTAAPAAPLPKKDPSLPPLPPPPRLRLNASGTDEKVGGKLESVGSLPPLVPLAPDEDPFLREKKFVVDGNLPKLPPLPPLKDRPVLTLNSGGHTGAIQNVFITQNGERIITVGEDKAVRVWDPKSGTTLNTFRFPAGAADEGALKAAALSPKGKLAVYGTPLTPTNPKEKAKAFGTIFILNLETGALVKTINAADDVASLHFSSDGNRLAAGGDGGTIQIFDATTGAQLNRFELELPINMVRFSPDPKAPSVLAVLTGGSQLYRDGGQLWVVDGVSSAKVGGSFVHFDVNWNIVCKNAICP